MCSSRSVFLLGILGLLRVWRLVPSQPVIIDDELLKLLENGRNGVGREASRATFHWFWLQGYCL